MLTKFFHIKSRPTFNFFLTASENVFPYTTRYVFVIFIFPLIYLKHFITFAITVFFSKPNLSVFNLVLQRNFFFYEVKFFLKVLIEAPGRRMI